MRDYQATTWLRRLAEEKKGIRNITAAEEELCASAVDFLSATRCFLHYSNGRNDNTLTYELQEAAAERALGIGDGVKRTPAEWMQKRSEEHTSELQSRGHLVCRLLLEKKNIIPRT